MSKAQEIADYLKSHPEFFDQHYELLKEIDVAAVTTGNPFYERQLQVLRDRQSRQKAKIEFIIDSAKANQALESGLHEVVIQLLMDSHGGNPNKENLILCVRDQFDVDGMTVLIESELASSENEIDYAAIYQRISHKGSICDDRLPRSLIAVLFPESGETVQSCAFIPLVYDDAIKGVLCLGSINPERFQPGFEVMFLNRLGAVAAAYLQPRLI